ncbi:MAG TPA: class I SAM-dependent methyltransferase [Acidimicrobiales bacterium]|jgi:SAM-dependent methyltransferase
MAAGEDDERLRLFENRRRAGSFGEAADDYDEYRPTYPDEMVQRLLSDGPVHVLDVGCGTGITTRLFAACGCEVLGVEPDPRMAAVARRRGSTVDDGNFETWEHGDRRFDLLVAGQAWHWVEPHAGARQAAAVLRPGGRIGLFWNSSFPEGEARQAIDAVYHEVAPELAAGAIVFGRGDDLMYEAVAHTLRTDGGFVDVSVEQYAHDVAYTTSQWLGLVNTHSDHRTMPDDARERLFAALRPAIDGAGGQVPMRYTTTLVTGRTPG